MSNYMKDSFAQPLWSSVIVCGLMVGTGGLSDANYVVKRQARGYPFALFGKLDSLPIESVSTARSAADDLSRIRDVLNPTVSELANAFAVSRQTIYNWQAGEQPLAENVTRLKDLASVADMFASEGVSASSQLLRRKISAGKSLLDIVREGEGVHDAARTLLQVVRRENEQQKTLAARLAGRRAPNLPDEFGTPMLDERA